MYAINKCELLNTAATPQLFNKPDDTVGVNLYKYCDIASLLYTNTVTLMSSPNYFTHLPGFVTLTV